MNKRAAVPPAPTHGVGAMWGGGPLRPTGPAEAAAASRPPPGARANPPRQRWPAAGILTAPWTPPLRRSAGLRPPSAITAPPGSRLESRLESRQGRAGGGSRPCAPAQPGAGETRFEGAPFQHGSQRKPPRHPPGVSPRPSSVLPGPGTRPVDSSGRLQGSGRPAVPWAHCTWANLVPSLTGICGQRTVATAPEGCDSSSHCQQVGRSNCGLCQTWRWHCLVMPRSLGWHGTWPTQVAFHA